MQYLEKLRSGKIALAKDIAKKLSSCEFDILRKAGLGGKLFGSVTNRDIQELLKESGFEFERKSILLKTPIRSAGIHDFSIRVHSDVNVSLKIKVTGETTENSKAETLDEQSFKQNNNEALADQEETEKLEEINEKIDE